MADVTVILSRIEHGDPEAAEQLLPLVYDELRKLATAKLANEKPGQTLQALFGAAPADVLAVKPTLLTELGLVEALGMVRMRGLHAILHRIKFEVQRAIGEAG